MRPVWEQRAPGRFRYELDALVAVVGDTLRIDEDALSNGILIVELMWPLDGKAIPLRAAFPDSFPRFRPLVNLLGDPATFPKRHCSPDGSLCLLGRDTGQWPNKWTLVDLLKNQLKDALEDTGDQDPQGEPAEFWWNLIGLKNSFCLVDSSWELGGSTSGRLKLSYDFEPKDNDPFAIRAIVTEVKNDRGEIPCTWTSKVPAAIISGREMVVPWVYRNETLMPINLDANQLVGLFPVKPKVQEFNAATSGRIFALLHKIELGPGNTGLGWIFLIEHGHPRAFKQPKPGKRVTRPSLCFIPTLRAGTDDIGARVPATSVLHGKKILVAGIGAIGAPLALDLARNGCSQLELLDQDTTEPGNSIRWSLGVGAWGKTKASALAEFINSQYPWCHATPTCHRIGAFDNAGGDNVVLSKLLEGAHLVVDASAEYGIATITSDYCREQNLPLVSFGASPPVTGGVVGYFHPQSGCPTCLEFAHETGVIPRAPGFESDEGLQQPPGCAEMTFTGASYDLQELSLQAMRVVVKSLSAPVDQSMIYTLALPGNAEPPSWSSHPLSKMDGCSCRTI